MYYLGWYCSVHFEMLVLYNIGNFSGDVAKPDDIGLYRYWEE